MISDRDILAAHELIAPYVRHTPVVTFEADVLVGHIGQLEKPE